MKNYMEMKSFFNQMFSTFDELKEVKYFKKMIRLNRFQKPCNEKYFKVFEKWQKWKITFEESSKSRGVFRNQASIYNGAFF